MQKSKKRASAKPKPARRPLNAEKWSPPSPANAMSGIAPSHHVQGKQVMNNRFTNGTGLSQISGNRINGVQYNRRFPQSGGSGRFANVGSSANFSKSDYARPYSNQAQKLRTPNTNQNMTQNMQQNNRNYKQQMGAMPQYPANNLNKRNGPYIQNVPNHQNMNIAPGRQAMTPNKQMNGNQVGIKNFQPNYNNNSNRNNISAINNSRGNYEQYRPLLQEYFSKNNLGSLEYKTATLETKVSGPNNNQGAKSFKTSKLMKRFISTVKVHDKNYQTFPQDFPTSDAAEEAAAKLACIQLDINKASLGTSGEINSNKCEPMTSQATSANPISSAIGNDTDFGDWMPPTKDTENVSSDSNDTEELKMIQYIDRIIQLVGKRSNGVWSTQIDVEYSQTFKDRLPDNWPDKIEKIDYGSKRLRIDRPIPGRCIILPNLEFTVSRELSDSSSNKANGQNSEITSAFEKEQATKSPSSSMSEDKNFSHQKTSLLAVNSKSIHVPSSDVKNQNKPPKLSMPEEELWDVYVTHVHSTMNVCLRLLGDEYSSKFDDLVTNMELHYFNSDTMPSVLDPTVGKLYAAKVDGEWHRVEVTNVSENSSSYKIYVYFCYKYIH